MTKPLLSERMREWAERTTEANAAYHVNHYAAEVSALESALARRTEDLSKFGRCLPTCATQQDDFMVLDVPCTCGFSAALTGERK